MAEPSDEIRPDPTPERVSGLISRAILEILSDHGIAANELVVTGAELRGTGDRAAWVISVLRGRESAEYRFAPELIEKVLTRGPSAEWRQELRKLLGNVGLAFPG